MGKTPWFSCSGQSECSKLRELVEKCGLSTTLVMKEISWTISNWKLNGRQFNRLVGTMIKYLQNHVENGVPWDRFECKLHKEAKNLIKEETLTRSEVADLVVRRNPTLGSIAEKFGVKRDELENDLIHKLHMADLTEAEVRAVIGTLINTWLHMPVICGLTPIQSERDINVAIAAVKRSRK